MSSASLSMDSSEEIDSEEPELCGCAEAEGVEVSVESLDFTLGSSV